MKKSQGFSYPTHNHNCQIDLVAPIKAKLPTSRLVVLVILGLLMSLSRSTAAWTEQIPMIQTRVNHTATLLTDGRVLVVGGSPNIYGNYPLAMTEFFNPADGNWTQTGYLNTAREGHTATLLPDGQVLVTGGLSAPYGASYATVAELYSPGLGTWEESSTNTARYLHTATLLQNGKVLVTGGRNTGPLNTAEIYDPISRTWNQTTPMNIERYIHTATLLPNGKVLVAGGKSNLPTNPEIYDPATETWTLTAPMNVPRLGHTATLLPNGKVLVAAGGTSGSTKSAELYDPANGTWTPTGSLADSRWAHTATLLEDGRVLVTGGQDGYALASSELYDPITGSWARTGSLHSPRSMQTATLLTNGTVLVTGGAGPYYAIPSVELYQLQSNATVIIHDLNQTYTGYGCPVSVETVPPGLAVEITYDGNSYPPVNAGSYSVVVTVNDLNYEGRATNTLEITPASASITFGNLNQVYDGNAKEAYVLTEPYGLPVSVSYDGATNAPIDAGNYTVVATITDSNYTGVATNILVVAKATAMVFLSNLAQIYDGFGHKPNIQVIPPFLPYNLTIGGTNRTPVESGSYPLIVVITDPNYEGGATNTFIINKAPIFISFGSLNQFYDGTPKSPSVSKSLPGVPVSVTYNGITNIPVNSGIYTVVAVPANTNYVGGATNTFIINKTPIFVSFGSLNQFYNGTPKSATVSVSLPNVPVSVTYNGSTNPPIDSGAYTIVAIPVNTNYAGGATNIFIINKTPVFISFGSLNQFYDGTPRSPSISASLPNIPLTVTYNGAASAPINSGAYTVVAISVNTNYAGGATNTFVINKAPVFISFGSLNQVYNGTPRSATVSVSLPSAAISVTYNGSLNPPIESGSYTLIARPVNTNYAGGATNIFLIQKAPVFITLGNLFRTYDGTPKLATVSVNPPTAAVSVTYDGSINPPINAGTYTVIALPLNTNYYSGATNLLVIKPKAVFPTLSNLFQIYDGIPKSVSVTTVPAGLAVSVSYNGSTNPPTAIGSYAVVATVVEQNYAGIVYGTLLIGTAPSIVSQPSFQIRIVGDTASFSVTAGGTEPLSYQWRKDGVNLVDATNSVLTLTNVQTNDPGSYSVFVSSPFGSVTSLDAPLIVRTIEQAIERLYKWVDVSGNPPVVLLRATLSKALEALNRENTKLAINHLSTFQNQVRAQVAKEDQAFANELIEMAQNIITALQRS